MEKPVYALLCFLVIVTTLGNSGQTARVLTVKIGSVEVSNSASDMQYLTTVLYDNGTRVDDPKYSTLPRRSPYKLQVHEGTAIISSHYTMTTPSGKYYQNVTDWANLPGVMPVPCGSTCFWAVDKNGFSVATTEQGPFIFALGWAQLAL